MGAEVAEQYWKSESGQGLTGGPASASGSSYKPTRFFSGSEPPIGSLIAGLIC